VNLIVLSRILCVPLAYALPASRVSDPAPHAFPFTTLLAVPPHDMHFRE